MMDDPRLKAAIDTHQAGNLEEAARLYSEVLRTDPKNFGALYLLGFLHLQVRDFERASDSWTRPLPSIRWRWMRSTIAAVSCWS